MWRNRNAFQSLMQTMDKVVVKSEELVIPTQSEFCLLLSRRKNAVVAASGGCCRPSRSQIVAAFRGLFCRSATEASHSEGFLPGYSSCTVAKWYDELTEAPGHVEIALFPLPMMCFGQIVGLMQQRPAAADDATAAWRAVTEAPGHVEIGLFPLPIIPEPQILR